MISRRGIVRATPALAATSLLQPVAARAQTPPKTFVLVHGAWHGGWCWRDVAAMLRSSGHRVFTPTFTGLGDRAHLLSRDVGLETFVQDILAVFDMEDLTDVILVGHSFGGGPVAMVADRIPDRIAHLVFLDAGLGESGQNAFATIPHDVVAQRLQAAMESSAGISLPAPPPDLFGVTTPNEAAWLRNHLRPHPLKTYTDPLLLAHPMGNGLKVTYIACVQPGYPPLASSHNVARQKPGWSYIEFPSVHDAMVLKPKDLTDVLTNI